MGIKDVNFRSYDYKFYTLISSRYGFNAEKNWQLRRALNMKSKDFITSETERKKGKKKKGI